MSTGTISQADFDLLRSYIHKECALEISEQKKYLISSRLTPILTEIGAKSWQELHDFAKKDFTNKIRDRIVDAITTHETLWFRDDSLWRAMREKIMPDLMDQLKSGKKRRIRIWSAASSTGQEPYSLAMLIDSMCSIGTYQSVDPSRFEIIASDVSTAAIETAKKATYSKLEIQRGLDDNYIRKYFTQTGDAYQLNPTIANKVRYRTFNLQDNFISLGRFDMILCRNVLIYFSQEFKRLLLRRMAMILEPGGLLILGSAESGLGHSESFEMREHKNSIYYQLKEF